MEKINFDEINNSKFDKSLPTLSVSKINTMITKEKDRNKMLQNTYNKHYNNPESEYYHMEINQISDMWEEKASASKMYGSLLDDYIGVKLTGSSKDMKLYNLDNDVDNDERLKSLIVSFEHFYEVLMASNSVEFVDREQSVFYKMPNPDYDPNIPESTENYKYINIVGRFDALFYNKTSNKWIIIDWKSTKNISSSNKYSKLQGPAKILDECDHNLYTIQGYFYKTALLANYLPEGTNPDNVIFLIVQLPGYEVDTENHTDFKIHKANFAYKFDFMNKLFEYTISRNNLINS